MKKEGRERPRKCQSLVGKTKILVKKDEAGVYNISKIAERHVCFRFQNELIKIFIFSSYNHENERNKKRKIDILNKSLVVKV